ncbi:type I glyceraldehyde-3-phosphate dehydrogenase [Mycoplasmatota bacterium WC44]
MKKVAINGFGRIGRLTFRELFDQEGIEIVAINDSGSPEMLAHILKYDSAHGKYKVDSIEARENSIVVDGKEVIICSDRDPRNLPWRKLQIDLVLECTGAFKTTKKSLMHIEAGAKKVLISAPPKDKETKQIVFSVNEGVLDGSELVVSASSCTTNCLTPAMKSINDRFEVISGSMNTIHAYTNDQRIMDAKHKDMRRARAGATNIIPTSTGAAKAIDKVIPSLKGKLAGMALRVPVITGSYVDLKLTLKGNVTAEEINNAFEEDSSDSLGITYDPLVSSDIIGIKYGSLVDGLLTKTVQTEVGTMVSIGLWYDNEMSYTSQYVRLTKYILGVK